MKRKRGRPRVGDVRVATIIPRALHRKLVTLARMKGIPLAAVVRDILSLQ